MELRCLECADLERSQVRATVRDFFPTLPLWVYALLSVALLAQWILGAWLELSFDEAYYWLWSQHLQLSYYDHPPLVAWLIALSTTVFGNGEFGVRFLAPVLIFASCLLLGRAARDFGGGRRAEVIATLIPICTIAGQVAGLIITPDTPLFFTSVLLLRFLAALYCSDNLNWWLAIGIAGGLALLSKYSAIALGLGIFVWLVFSKSRRKYFLTWQLWVGLALALLIFLPVIIWNAQHNWVSFAKQGGRAIGDFSFSLKTAGDFVGAQVGLLTPLLAMLVFYAGYRQIRAAFAGNDRAILLCALALPFPFYIFTMSLGMKVEANWALVALPSLIILTALEFERGKRRKNWACSALYTGGILSAALLLYLTLSFQHGLGRADITHRLSGHRDVADKLQQAAYGKNICAVVVFEYADHALLNYYLRGRLHVVQLGEPNRIVEGQNSALSKCAEEQVLVVTSQGISSVPSDFTIFHDVRYLLNINRWHRGAVVDSYVIHTAILTSNP